MRSRFSIANPLPKGTPIPRLLLLSLMLLVVLL